MLEESSVRSMQRLFHSAFFSISHNSKYFISKIFFMYKCFFTIIISGIPITSNLKDSYPTTKEVIIVDLIPQFNDYGNFDPYLICYNTDVWWNGVVPVTHTNVINVIIQMELVF